MSRSQLDSVRADFARRYRGRAPEEIDDRIVGVLTGRFELNAVWDAVEEAQAGVIDASVAVLPIPDTPDIPDFLRRSRFNVGESLGEGLGHISAALGAPAGVTGPAGP